MRPSRYTDTSNTQFDWQVVRALWPYLLEFRKRVFWALSCLIFAKLASVGLPFVLKYIVDDLNERNAATAIISVPLALIFVYGFLRLANVLLGEVRDTLFGRVTERAMRRVGLKVFRHLHALDLNFHLNRQTGGLSRDIERGTSGISFLMRFMVFNIIPTLLEITLVVGVLFYNYGTYFALVLVVSVVSYVAFSVVATNWRTKYVREVNAADSTTNSRAIDSLLNYETVKYFNNEVYEADRYDTDLAIWEKARRKNRLSLFALNGGQAGIIAIAMTTMMAMAAVGVAKGNMTIGDFVLINAFTMQIFMPLNFLGFVYREIRGSLANIENLFNLMKTVPTIKDPQPSNELVVQTARVEFDNVHFYYNKQRPILEGISFSIEPGQTVAVVGESGAGKSTLVKLLFRFYDVTKGRILIDGNDIRQVSQESVRRTIGIVPQDTVLFNDTIFENVKYGRPEASDDEVLTAIRLAHLDKFVASLPKGLQTQVGERGLKLSGGEKQRVAIARTILKRPPILLFDEATSSLDSHSEKAILAALKEIARGHTSLVIAHRLSTIKDADMIAVMENGRIVETGTHASLMNACGLYHRMWLTQHPEDAFHA